MFIAALSIKANPKPINLLMDTQSVIYPYSRILFICKKEVPIHVTTWMNIENIMLSKRTQPQKTTYCMIAFILNVQKRQIYRDRKYISIA